MEYPYVLECKKCGVQFRADKPYHRYCKICRYPVTKKYVYPRVFYKNKKIVFERDECKCQCCGCEEDGQITNKLVVHHIDVDRHNNSPSNLITLCLQCHHSLHSKYEKSFLRRSNIYKLFAGEKSFGEFGKNLIYESARKLVKKQFKGKPKFFFGP